VQLHKHEQMLDGDDRRLQDATQDAESALYQLRDRIIRAGILNWLRITYVFEKR
jgi:hypothetical protein